MITKNLSLLVIISTSLIVSSLCYAGDFYGTGDNLGSGYTRDSAGNLYGSGDNLGSGYIRDSAGNLYGTGDNLGRGFTGSSFGDLYE